MESNSRRFIDAFVKIEIYLKKYLNDNVFGFTHMVHQAAKTNSSIQYHMLDLIEYAQLRNAIVHNRSENNELIAEPHLEVVETIEAIYKELENPKRIKDLNLKKVYVTSPDELVLKLSKIQEEYNYSIVPVYEGNQYVGLVHSKLYQSAYAKQARNLRVEELLEFRKEKNRVVFMTKDSELREIIRVYFDLYEKGKGIIGIIVNEKGFMNERPLAIITPADLPKIFEILE